MMLLGVVSCLLLFIIARQGGGEESIRKVPNTKKETMALLSILEKRRENRKK